jgi:hypothetical protein
MKDLETSFAPDTSKLSTLQEAFARQQKYNALKSKSRNIDEEFRSKLFNESVVSSLIFDQLTLDVLKPLFEIKLDDTINSFLTVMLSDPIIKKEITKAYGTGTEKMADFIREYNNNLINFIFQNYISYFYNQKGEFINIPEVYDTLPVVIDDNIETDVEVLSDKIKVNSKLIEFDYATKSFLNTNDTEFGYAQRGLTTFNKLNNPFQNLPQFYRYVISREVLAKKNSPESLRDDSHFLTLLANNNNNPRAAYEDYISERALLNSFNRSYIMGKTKFSYTEDLLQIISELENTSALKDRFPILGQLSRLPNKDGFKIIRLNNRRDVKGDAAQEYKRQITQLADPTVKKLDNPNNDPIIASKEKRLTELFSVFSLMMYYQHGVGKTATGFTNVLDSSQYISTMRDASEAFMGNYIYNNSSEGVLNIIFNISKSKKKFKNLNSQANRYIHTEYAEIEEEVNNTQANEFVLEFDLEEGLKNEIPEFKPGERLISETDVDRFKKLFAKLGTKPETFFTEDTKFSKFYNGRKQGMPQSAGWYLNEATGLYDMIDQDPDSGEVYYQNVDLLTGLQMIKEGEGTTQPTVSNNPTEFTNHSGGAYGGDTYWDVIGREYGVTKHKHYRDAGNTSLSAQLRKSGVQAEVLTKEQMDEARTEVERLLGKKYPDTTEGNLQVRNYYQVANADAVFAIAEIEMTTDKSNPNLTDSTKSKYSYFSNKVKGGTNTAVQLGIQLGKPVYVWDLKNQFWTQFDGKEFVKIDTPVLTKNFAGVGSRDIEDYSIPLEKDSSGKVTKWGKTSDTGKYKGLEIEESVKQAIREVYEKTLTEPISEPAGPTQPTEVKLGVQELFESNPELVNQVYEALGFNKQDTNIKDLSFELIDSDSEHDYFKIFYKGKDLATDGKVTTGTITLSLHNQGYIDAIEIPTELRNKGLGKSIYRKVNSELLNGSLKSDSLGRISEDAKRVWESLVKSGEAIKTSTGYEFKKNQITPQQKQQALQLYSQYLNTVFPNSKVKDIVYHGTTSKEKFEKFQLKYGNDESFQGFYFADTKFQSKAISGKEGRVFPVLLNANPKLGEFGITATKEDIEKAKTEGYNALREEDDLRGDDFNTTIVFEPEQIHILGTKQDIEGFKEFVSGRPIAQPTETGGEKSSISDDMAEYAKLIEQNNGVQPKTFTVGTRTWTLNKFGNYDWADPTSGQIYMRNIDMETGESIPEPALNEPVNPELIQKDLEYIDSIRKALELDIKFAELGYNLNDLIKRLAGAKTMKEYNDVQEIFNKLC